MAIIDKLQDSIFVAFGAVIGVNLRFTIYQKLERINLNKDYIVLLINILSSFFLGLCVSILTKISSFNYSYQLGLFFSIGLLGSFSTFSSFIYDLYQLLVKLKLYKAFELFTIGISSGIIFFALGFFWAK